MNMLDVATLAVEEFAGVKAGERFLILADAQTSHDASKAFLTAAKKRSERKLPW